jgi:hypothetical protein
MPRKGEIPREAAKAGLSLMVLALAYYISPGEERTKLLAWMDAQADAYERDGVPRDVLRYFREMVHAIRLGHAAELLKSAHRSDQGLH